ncbi:MAG: dimethyl sulfoxide reductase anchor subunit [Coriobacteriales bacterium]|jgi:anaerobic dimethyl sulfoxide reductase subunit C (anchor subunit)|nr:dimethyl sulfoxide reductase anchor subunit [Coriobacteriales bacterium]
MSIQWPLVCFTLFAGTGAGTLVFIGLAELLGVGAKLRKLAAWIAAALMVVGGIASVFHLGSPLNFMSAVTNLGSLSGISIELIMLALGIIVAVIYALLAKTEDSSAVGKGLGLVALVIGLVLCWSFGSSYMLGTRPAWNTLLLPAAYACSGLTMGGFLYLTLLAVKKADTIALKKTALFVLLTAALGTLAFLAFGITAGEPVLVDNGVLFWVGVVVVGTVLPLIAGFMVWKNGKGSILIFTGLACALVGGLAFRVLMWLAGSPAILNLFDVAANNRGYYPF